MGKSDQKGLVVYSSPAGTTRHVSQVISNTLKELGYESVVYDLGNKDERSKLNLQVKDWMNNCCLWIGTPVYAGHAVPPITDFISKLPVSNGSYAIPFVTWGAVTSGIALPEMGKMLNEKGYTVLGAAKVLAVHSMMWDVENPLGEGHPDAEDDAMMKKLVESIDAKLSSSSIQPLRIEDLNYQPQPVQESMQKVNIEIAKQMLPPRQLDEEACTQCGTCEEVCPAGAIKLDPYPQFGSECFLCYNCVRLCEENAIKTDLSQFTSKLREGAEKMGEQPLSQIFV